MAGYFLNGFPFQAEIMGCGSIGAQFNVSVWKNSWLKDSGQWTL